MQLSNQQRHDMHSGDYVDLVESVPISRMTRLVPLMALTPETRLVDFACGSGPLSALVDRHVASYEGVDFSQDFVDAARRIAADKGIANATFHCESIEAFCARHAPEYDVVVANDFSEHVYDEDFLSIFRGACDILKPGGHLYIYTPNRTFFWEWMKEVGLAKQFPQHVAVRNAAQYRGLLVDCGFDAGNIDVRYLSHFNVFRFLHPLRHLPLIGKWFEAKLFIACRR
jgi:2-polyprenyl-6-hydroxyphenyl methylase / 3-demethylubiquinone-9 3-methyltransferase